MKSLISIAVVISLNGFAQTKDTLNGKFSSELIYETVAVQLQPEFPGGVEEMYKFLAREIDYPKLAKELKISGKVFVEFVIGRNGKIRDVNLKKGVKAVAKNKKMQIKYDQATKEMNDNAMNAIKRMPAWTPGHQDNVPVSVRYIIPINYSL